MLECLYMQKMRKIIFFLIFIFFLTPSLSFSASIMQDKQEIFKAKVVDIVEEGLKGETGIDKDLFYQNLKAEILDGTDKGQIINIENDFIKLKDGQKFYLLKLTRADDQRVSYVVHDVERIPWIIFFTLLFVVLVVIFGGVQGLRGLLSLAGGMFLIFYILLPQIVAGASPLLVSIFVASLIVVVGSYITHGFNRTTTSAVVGMVITVVLTGLLAYFAVHITALSGMDNEEATYLSLNSYGALDLGGLLMGGIIIGLLGVLYDSAIGQSISVEELWRANPALSRKYVFKRALRIGREHIGALVNTLAIAYVGASLPLLVLFSFPNSVSTMFLVNREMFATEIIRALIGSIGLVLAVPITTMIAVIMLHGRKFKGHTNDEHHSHSHAGHSHT